MAISMRCDPTQQNVLKITTGCGADDQFSSPRQIRWSAALGKLIISDSGNTRFIIRNNDLSYCLKYYGHGQTGIDSDALNIYSASSYSIRKYTVELSTYTNLSVGNGGIRMLDASGDPDYVYASSNNSTDHHGFRQIKKSTMAITASALADGSGDGQFNNPLGIFYYNSEVFVADYDNSRISVWTKSGETLTYNRKYDLGYKPMDLCFDGVNWFVQSATTLYKYDNVFTDATKTSVANVGYSITLVPDQSDGNGATIAFTDNTNSRIGRRKCSDLTTATDDVGSSGNGSSTLFDPVITGPTGTWQDSEGGIYSVASAANISKNGFSGDFFKQSPNRLTYKPVGGLATITAIDSNTDAIQGEIKNLKKCINCTSYKLYANTALTINLADISSKAITVQIYSCGLGVIPADLSKCAAVNDIRLQDNSWTTAMVDQFIQWIYAGRAGFTDAARAMRIGANNGAPTGNYTDPTVTPGNGSSNSDWSWDAGLGYHLPLTPNAMVYRLLHAVEAGVTSWTLFSTA